MLIELSKFALDCKVAHVSGRELAESCEKQTKKIYKKHPLIDLDTQQEQLKSKIF